MNLLLKWRFWIYLIVTSGWFPMVGYQPLENRPLVLQDLRNSWKCQKSIQVFGIWWFTKRRLVVTLSRNWSNETSLQIITPHRSTPEFWNMSVEHTSIFEHFFDFGKAQYHTCLPTSVHSRISDLCRIQVSAMKWRQNVDEVKENVATHLLVTAEKGIADYFKPS